MTAKRAPNLLHLVSAVAGGIVFALLAALMEALDVTVALVTLLGAVGALAACVLLAFGFRRSSGAPEPTLSVRVSSGGSSVKRPLGVGFEGVIRGSVSVEVGGLGIDAARADPVDARELSRPDFGDAPGQALARDPGRSLREEMACDVAAGSKPSGPGGAADRRLEPRVAPEDEQTLTGRESRLGRGAAADAGRTVVGYAVTICPGGKGRREGVVGIKPAQLSEAREGEPDDLTQIKGVGQKLEVMLHQLGIFHYDQIAGWNDKEAARVDENQQGARGRVDRNGWIEQARRHTSEKRTRVRSALAGGLGIVTGQGVIKWWPVTHD